MCITKKTGTYLFGYISICINKSTFFVWNEWKCTINHVWMGDGERKMKKSKILNQHLSRNSLEEKVEKKHERN